MAIQPTATEGGLASALVTALGRHEKHSTANLGDARVPSAAASSGTICGARETSALVFCVSMGVFARAKFRCGSGEDEGQVEEVKKMMRGGPVGSVLRCPEAISPDESRQRNLQNAACE